MNTLFPIKGNKILLRPFALEDHVAKIRIDKVRDINEYINPRSLEIEINEFQRLGYGLVAIVDNTTGEIVGCAKLQDPDWQEKLGLELVLAVVPKARRQGIAREAAQKLIGVACGPLKQRQVVVRVALSNTASLRLVDDLGMKKIGDREDLVDGPQCIYMTTSRQGDAF